MPKIQKTTKKGLIFKPFFDRVRLGRGRRVLISSVTRYIQSRERQQNNDFVAAVALYSRLRERNNNFFFVAPIYSCRAFVRQEYEGISGFVRRGGAALVLALLLCGWLSVKASRGRILARSHTATASPDLVCAVGACVRWARSACRPRRCSRHG